MIIHNEICSMGDEYGDCETKNHFDLDDEILIKTKCLTNLLLWMRDSNLILSKN